MIPEALAAYESVKAATTIARGLQSLNTQSEINLAVIDLQQKLLETQQFVLALQEKVQEMKERVTELEKIDSDQFEIADLVTRGHSYTGIKVYRHKETEVLFCPVCFGQKKLIPLQFSSGGQVHEKCGACQTFFGTSDGYNPSNVAVVW